MRRNTPLKSDPDKARAGRQRAAERYQDKRARRALALLEAGVSIETLARVSKQRMEREGEVIRRRGTTMRDDRKGFAASPTQQAKTRAAGACRVLTAHEHDEPEHWPADVRSALMSWNGPAPIDSAHVAGAHACEDPACTVPLSRPLHDAYDDHRLNILRYLTREEEAHAALEVGILRALERVSCCRMVPGADVADDRLRHMTYDEQAEVVAERGLVEALPHLTGVSWWSAPREVVA